MTKDDMLRRLEKNMIEKIEKNNCITDQNKIL